MSAEVFVERNGREWHAHCHLNSATGTWTVGRDPGFAVAAAMELAGGQRRQVTLKPDAIPLPYADLPGDLFERDTGGVPLMRRALWLALLTGTETVVALDRAAGSTARLLVGRVTRLSVSGFQVITFWQPGQPERYASEIEAVVILAR